MKQILILGLLVFMGSCTAAPENLQLHDGKLRACPGTPNCVSSETQGIDSWVSPLSYQGSSATVFNQIKSVLIAMGADIQSEKDGYLSATYTSRVFRFVDDVEFRLDSESSIVHIRSGSRIGRSDYGVNRKRVEEIRKQFTEKNKQYEQLTAEATEIVKGFVSTMQPQLAAALQSGGPVKAIDVCSVKAQEIAQEFSSKTDWEVHRVSLKNRNNQSGKPDAWEEKVLHAFDVRQQKGEPAELISYAEIVDKQFRYMKAQGVQPICLACHGENLLPEVKASLQEHYPDDKATGYIKGQIRGAFSLSKEL